jgi:aspartyl-tRNA(Asn)/glutamyl-tRNA(Gln) amidotransferase subunit A
MKDAVTPTDLADFTATELLDAYETGAASPIEAVEACLARMDSAEPSINAVLSRLDEVARAQARESGKRWASGEQLPFDGIPFGLKDIIATTGVRTTGGSALYRDWVPSEGAALATRMTDAGGVLLAKLQTYEFACGGSFNKTFGIVRNPWDTDRTTGGSSSGSAAAVAARELPVAIGTDTGGSIRIPAAWCGITGLKATFGRVPRHGVMGLSWTMDHAGPMTRTVADTALTLGVIAGHDKRDPTSSTRPVPDYLAACKRHARGLRVGVPENWFLDKIHPAVATAFETSLEALEAAGMTLTKVRMPTFDVIEAVGWTIVYAELSSLHEYALPTIEDRDAACSDFYAVAPFVTATDYLRAMRVRRLLQSEVEAAFESCDLIASPGSPSIAPLLADMKCDLGDEQLPWLEASPRVTVPWNVTGNPALTVPAGFVDGLPVSLQLAGRPYDEETILAAGAAYESLTGYYAAQPAMVAGGERLTASVLGATG